jgi:predicted Rossmann fold nucleotide-binding protein DprA/Smf involved in DNA uptake
MAERIAIIGSRDYPDLERVRAYVRSLPSGVIVVSGGARGVDSAAESEARRRGLEVVSIRPDYAQHGRRAPLVRNAEIVAQSDRVVAFWDEGSSGTAYTIRLARQAGKPVEIVRNTELS